MIEVILEIIGWVGTFLVVLAFYLSTSNRLDVKSKSYLLMNIIGSIFVGANVLYKGAYPAVALNAVWILISLISLIKIKSKR